MNQLKQYVLQKYGSINDFFEATQINISRTNLYAILNNPDSNPQINTIIEMAKALELEFPAVVEMLKNEHIHS